MALGDIIGKRARTPAPAPDSKFVVPHTVLRIRGREMQKSGKGAKKEKIAGVSRYSIRLKNRKGKVGDRYKHLNRFGFLSSF